MKAAAKSGPASPAAVPAAYKEYLRGDRTDLQWPLRVMNVPQAWGTATGEGVVVATIDSGVDRTVPDLAGRLLPSAYVDPATGGIVTGNRPDEVGHGTHVAGIIVGNNDGRGVTGVAPGAKLLAVNIQTSVEVTTTQVASAITYATAKGARVINLSLGFLDIATTAQTIRPICAAVKAAVSKNVVVVAAAGNDGTGANTPQAPASCPGTISVVAADSSLRPASWSSFDSGVTVAAPGENIYSTVSTNRTPQGFSAESGTSMAAPHVAGLAALLLQQNPRWTPAQVSARLVETATDLPPAGRDPRSGAGLVNAAKALGVSDDAPSPAPSLAVTADAYASRTVGGRDVFDQIMLHWVPDSEAQVTEYRVTRWTAKGKTTTTYPGDTVRALFPNGPAGYQVTASTEDDGEVLSAPVWFPMPDQDATPVYPVTSLKASWARNGSVTVTWANPAKNRDHADEYSILVNGDPVYLAEGLNSLPARYTIPAAKVPEGDLSISFLIGASSNQDVAETSTRLAARVPFSGTAVSAGKGRYRVNLTLAPSRRNQCVKRCSGVGAIVAASGSSSFSRIDSRGAVVVLVSTKPVKGKLTVSVTVPTKPQLSGKAVAVPVA